MFVERFSEKTGVYLVLTPPYHPSSNGQAERMVATVKGWLKKTKSGKGEMWVKHLYYNNAMGNDGLSPAEKMIGQKVRMFLDMLIPRKAEVVVEDIDRRGLEYTVGQLVWIRLYGSTKKWKKGVVIENLGYKLNRVKFDDNSEGVRHRDQLRKRVHING
ncbi:uncharacterized protein LOC135929005 [Gordionus sp. m RMFG-2023]|uniref:uncharacterized protein LOC135929005 n=1 Tax=Gordionus sp. m RMFG-2023 TaxID=3053472 RepID=UPI0031FC84CE